MTKLAKAVCVAALGALAFSGCSGEPVAKQTAPPKHLLPRREEPNWLTGKRLWGYIDGKGTWRIPPQFGRAWDFEDGMALVLSGDKYGWIDRDGEVVIPPQYDMAMPFEAGLAGVCLNSQWGFIDKTGKTVIPLEYESVGSFDLDSGLACVRVNGKWGAINRSGETVIEPRFDNGFHFRDGRAVVRFDQTVSVPAPAGGTYTATLPLVERVLTIDGTLLPGEYRRIDPFSEGLAPVLVGGERVYRDNGIDLEGAKWGYIDRDSNMVIEPRFESAGFFEDGRAEVELDGERFEIDKTGQRVGDGEPR